MKRRLIGKVVSNKMDKTIVISVERVKEHPIYKKKYKVSKRFKAHAENAKEVVMGSVVTIEESRPMSKEKRWKIVNNNQSPIKSESLTNKSE